MAAPMAQEGRPLAPEAAFSVLGDETRLQILHALSETREPIAYSALFDRIDYDDSANFTYHLNELVGPFVRKTDDGYDLYESGRRIVESVLSGAVTGTTVLEPTETDKHCPFCAAPIMVAYQDGRVELNCTACPGLARETDSGGRRFRDAGSLGYFLVPPAAVEGRSPGAILEAAWTWRHVDFLADSSGVCSRCSASLEREVIVCPDHDSSGQYCDQCGRRQASLFHLTCPTCHYEGHAIAPGVVLDSTALLSFLTDHGINPLAPAAFDRAMAALADYEETVHTIDPYEASLTFSVNRASITVTVNDTLAVIAVERSDRP